MQQHTGQHVLSAAFDHLFNVRTVSFHLGAAVSTIDLAREMSAAEIAAAEAEANRIVWEDRTVAIRFATAEEAAALPLRKEPARGGTLRLTSGGSTSPRGGTHVTRTGGNVIAVASWGGSGRTAPLFSVRRPGPRRAHALRDSVGGAVRRCLGAAGLPQAIGGWGEARLSSGCSAGCRPSWRATGPRN
jgi:alanyl-tRNA synthetase